MDTSSTKNESRHDEQYYRSLSRNMAVNIITVALAPMLLVAAIFAYQFTSAYSSKVRDHLEELVLKHRQEIDTFLAQQVGVVRFLANALDADKLSDENILAELLADVQQANGPYIVDLGFVDEQGTQVSYAGPFLLERASYAGAGWLERARSAKSFISDVFLGLRGQPHFIVSVQKRTAKGTYILRATVDFDVFSRLVEDIRVGETGFAYILNRQGEFQTQQPASTDECVTLPPEILGELGAGTALTLDAEDGRGREYLTVSAPLKDGDWRLVYQQNREDAFGPLMHTRMLSIFVLFVGGAVIVTVVLFLSRRMTGRVAQADSEKERMDKQVVEAGRLASIGELAAGIAHEINNPVAIMVEEAGWIEDLLEDGGELKDDTLDEFQRSLQQIRIQGQRCKEITHKLLHFARKTDTNARRIDMNGLVEQLVSLVEQRARYSKVSIVAQLQEGIPPVAGSPSEMQQVALNLINNAIDALGREGGLILVNTAVRDGENGRFVELKVSDNGPGIPQANQHKLFDPFFTTKPVGKGTGLGLSICYGIVKKMGGDIEVQSRSGEGATFIVTLPAADEQAFVCVGENGEEAA